MRDQQTNTTESKTTCGSELHNSITLKANQGEKKMNKDIYQTITDKIIESLENGVAPWVKPWASCGAPRNAVTGREYSGINMILLAMSPFANPLWLTYNQARAVNATVRKGEHGTQVVFFKPFKITDKNDAESKEKTVPLLRTYTVFNAQQIDNLPEKYTQAIKPQLDSFADNEQAEALLAKAIIEHGKPKACFIPTLDRIHLPNKVEFNSIPDYYATGLHELTHNADPRITPRRMWRPPGFKGFPAQLIGIILRDQALRI